MIIAGAILLVGGAIFLVRRSKNGGGDDDDEGDKSNLRAGSSWSRSSSYSAKEEKAIEMGAVGKLQSQMSSFFEVANPMKAKAERKAKAKKQEDERMEAAFRQHFPEMAAKADAEAEANSPPPAPAGDPAKEKPTWVAKVDPSSKQTFYYNRKTKAVSWTPPSELGGGGGRRRRPRRKRRRRSTSARWRSTRTSSASPPRASSSPT
jgi:hypothetical protein